MQKLQFNTKSCIIATKIIGFLISFPAGSELFISLEFTQLLQDHGIAISMDGKGCWRDNVFVKRLRTLIKSEEVLLRA